MPRYIDAEALKERIRNNWYTATEIDEDIDAEPTADVVERKRARWKGEGLGDYRCSLCGEITEYGRTNYCPNCGAEMRGKYD